MAREWVSTTAGAHLAGRRAKSTAPEVELRQAVHAAGGRFRLHRRLAKGCTPDFVLPGRKVAVFVDGCFWHGCPEHGRRKPWTGPNADLWEQKMQRNAERDRQSTLLAEELGWTVVRAWECQVRRDAVRLAAEIMALGDASSESGPI
ncbi:T/G mismatch-specific endonuclease [Humibacillus xanthopallidus]|uniref:T/G mismatch-specific endonuclease n=1 Tax=Humibacillus xanthopallidus TaxID=412689 RepID=A0A543PR27_9MICO|nr:very short patch repair endonuclease [Humibacillus xanthopallidus]TQN46532.1 T/G mismatch-specific endonuclease [Humibacillus xanthopallidus]